MLTRHAVIDDPTLDDVLATIAWAEAEAYRVRGFPAL